MEGSPETFILCRCYIDTQQLYIYTDPEMENVSNDMWLSNTLVFHNSLKSKVTIQLWKKIINHLYIYLSFFLNTRVYKMLILRWEIRQNQ